MMIPSHPIATPRFGPAVALVLAMLLALRCGVAWAGPEIGAGRVSGAALGKAHAAVLTPIRLAPARCEAIADDAPAPTACGGVSADWIRPTAMVAATPSLLAARAPAPPPPATGPPTPAA